MKRRTKLCTVLAALLFLMIAAQAFAGGDTEKTMQQEVVTLVVWEHTPQFEAPLSATLNNYMKENPNVKVVYEIKTPDQYYSLLQTAIQAGEAPDLFWTNGVATTHMGDFVKQGAVTDLTGEISLSEYPQLAKDMVTIEGKVFATPGSTIGTRAVYYDKDLLSAIGFSEPGTFADFENLLASLKAQDAVIPLSLGGRFSWSILFHFEPILAALHPDWIAEAEQGRASVNDRRVVAALDKMLEWGEKGYYGDGYLGMNEGAQLLAFSRGDAAMTITGSWNADSLKKNNPEMNIGAFQIPTRDGREPMVVTFSTGFCLYSKTEHPQAALTLARYLTSLESQQIWVDKLNDVPGLPQLETDDALVAEIVDNDFQVNSFYYILGLYAKEGADPDPTKLWTEDCIEVLSGDISPESFVEEISERMTM